MKVTIEFTGIARAITNAQKIEIEVPHEATYHDITRLLADRYPEMIGTFISSDTHLLLSSTVFINGKEMIPFDRMTEKPADGDYLTLLTVIVGG